MRNTESQKTEIQNTEDQNTKIKNPEDQSTESKDNLSNTDLRFLCEEVFPL